MTRRCRCRNRCPHWTRGGLSMLPTDRLAALEPALRTLIDAADAFDQAGLQIDPECGRHGTRPTPDDECICSGTRYSALEFAEWLQLEMRAAGATVEPAGRPGRKEAAERRLVLVTAG